MLQFSARQHAKQSVFCTTGYCHLNIFSDQFCVSSHKCPKWCHCDCVHTAKALHKEKETHNLVSLRTKRRGVKQSPPWSGISPNLDFCLIPRRSPRRKNMLLAMTQVKFLSSAAHRKKRRSKSKKLTNSCHCERSTAECGNLPLSQDSFLNWGCTRTSGDRQGKLLLPRNDDRTKNVFDSAVLACSATQP